MASVTVSFLANAGYITLTDRHGVGAGGVNEYSNQTNHPDPLVRAIAREWADNATASGVVTVTAV